MDAVHPSDQTLTSHRLGKLDGDSAASVQQHLEACFECRKRAARLSSMSFQGWIDGAQMVKGQSATQALPPEERTIFPVPLPVVALPPGLADLRDYEIKKELGRGGMGVVYLAHHSLLGRDEVLKVMGQHLIEHPGALDRFLREIRAVARLRHPNIVSAYSAFRLGDSIVFAMEYVEGLDGRAWSSSERTNSVTRAIRGTCRRGSKSHDKHSTNRKNDPEAGPNHFETQSSAQLPDRSCGTVSG